MSVGHVARVFEAAGLPTVIIAAAIFQDRLIAMSPPRLLTTPFWLGRPMGRPGDAATHRAVLTAALDLLDSATEPTIRAWAASA